MKTAQELKIEQWEHDGLVWLLGQMESNSLIHDPDVEYVSHFGFNMGIPAATAFSGCGSVCCMGGWVYARKNGRVRSDGSIVDFSGHDAANYVEKQRGGALSPLFFPYGFDKAMKKYGADLQWTEITPKAAAPVLRKFLETSEVDWELALQELLDAKFDPAGPTN